MVTEQEKAAAEKAKAQHPEKAQVEQHTPQKQVRHEELSKGKKEEPPGLPQTKVSQHPQYAVVHPQPQHHTEKAEKAHPQQQAVHQAHAAPPPHVAQAPHPPSPPHVAQASRPQQPHPQPHGGAGNNNQKKKNDHKG